MNKQHMTVSNGVRHSEYVLWMGEHWSLANRDQTCR